MTSKITPLLNGLVLTGGKSKRMNMDKSLIHYHGKSQVEYCFEILSEICHDVFVSNREDQSTLNEHQKFPQIHDKYTGIGPLGGILSAMSIDSSAAWLVLACDLPFVDKNVLVHLINNRDSAKMGTAYYSAHNPKFPEPLCAIYEPHSIGILHEFLNRGINCPRKILANSNVRLLCQHNKLSLENVNNPHELKKAVNLIDKGVPR